MAFPETVKGRVLVCKVRRNDSYSFEDFGSTEYAGPICKATCNRNNTSAGIRPPLQIGGDIVLSLHSYTTFNIDGETFLSVFEDFLSSKTIRNRSCFGKQNDDHWRW